MIYRKAHKEEADVIAKYFVSALPVESFLSMFDGLTEDGLVALYSECIADENTLYSYENTFVAVTEDGFVAGAVCGYDGADFKRLKQNVIQKFEEKYGPNPYSVCEETGPGEFYLDSIGVSPQMRSHGIGSNLFSVIIEYAVANGHKVIGLLVDEDNPNAERLYRRLGFEEVGRKDFVGENMKHMQLRC